MVHPYRGKPDSSFWRKAVVGAAHAEALDPVIAVPFTLGSEDLVATAGSCFAQHIARHLKHQGYRYFVAEAQPSADFDQDENFGLFSARYGNVYTTRQMLQLFQRAFGLFVPEANFWQRADGAFIDPFRPQIQKAGFKSIGDLEASRELHLAAVRTMFEQMDVFIFTLGLTEGWVDPSDGAVFPLAPGTLGVSEKSEAKFHNFTVEEMVADLKKLIKSIRIINPALRVIITVSPVPLVATYTNKHVLVANTYSKSALRVVADMVSNSIRDTAYFPSFEIITGAHTGYKYFETDLREVREEGVGHVMSVFARHFLGQTGNRASEPNRSSRVKKKNTNDIQQFEDRVRSVFCDEERNEI